MSALQITWFVLVVVLIAGYAVLDGFDLGVGLWHLVARGDGERRTMLNAIGPVWDGNEVWLLTAGGSLFAAFPPVYAATLSGFYLPIMLVLLGLIFRAVSIEFRSKLEATAWRRTWDVAFSLGSLTAAFLFGVAVGNVMRGLPLSPAGDYTGTVLDLLNPFSLLVGFTALAMFATHGALWIVLKTEGTLERRARRWVWIGWASWCAAFAALTVWVLAAHPALRENYAHAPALFALPAATAAALVAAAVLHRDRRALAAFSASSVAVVLLIATAAASLYPVMVPAADPARSLTLFNASSSERTLGAMLVVAGIGMPLVLLYTAYVYRTFKGKTEVDPDGY
jgi:cytochrome d ubiquinol oxidase subunit II